MSELKILTASRRRRAVWSRLARRPWPAESDADVAAFVMVDRPREFAARFASDAIMDPIATQEPLLGRLFLMNRDCSSGRSLPLPCAPGDLLDWLAEQGLGDRPVTVAYRATGKMTVRRDGVEDLMHPATRSGIILQWLRSPNCSKR